jgi:PAB-dependent poly(A)-specific ribonuclease subunit 2
MVEWTPGKSVAATIASTPTGQLCKAVFDPYEELFWVGNHDGRLNSFLLSSRELDIIDEEPEVPYGNPLNRHRHWELDVYRYTSFRAHDTAIKEIICHNAGVMTLDTASVKWTTRSGASTLVRLQDGADCFAFSSSTNNHHPFRGLECAASLFPSMHDVYICGNPGTMMGSPCVIHILNMAKGLIVKQVPLSLYNSTPYSIVKMKRTPRTIFCACDNGQVLIVDTRSFRVEQVLKTHSSTLVDLDFSWGQPLLATCGYNVRQESWGTMLLPEPWIRMFDIRTMRPLPPIPFSAGAHRVQFHPKLTSVMMGISMHGETLQVCDNLGSSSAGSFRYLPAPVMSNCVALEVASSGQLLAAVDTVGVIHLMEEMGKEGRDLLRINDHSRPTEMANHGIVAPDVFIGLDDYETPLSLVGMPYYEEPLLSGIWPSLKFKVGRPTPPIDPILLATMKWRNNIGYAPNPRKTRRNQAILSTESKDLEPMFRSVKERRQKWDITRVDANLDSGKTEVNTTSPISLAHADDLQTKPTIDDGLSAVWTDLPMAYRRVEIKYSKFGVEDFDFAFYNKTEFGGLESHITNSYCNALLQVFYFQPSLRLSMLSHMSSSPELCLNRVCLACELGFLFRMLDQSQGMNCQATNFLRVFSLIPQATALGLSEPDIPTSETPYAFLIQNFNRFILEQLHKETSLDSSDTVGKPTNIISPIEDLYAISMKVIDRCKCGAETPRTSQLFTVDLIYPKKSVTSTTIEDTAAIDSFAKLLIASLARKTNLRAWCDICKAYEPTSQSRQMNPSFPNILNINCGPVNQEYFDLWLRKEMHSSADTQQQQQQHHSSLPAHSHKSWFPLSLSIQVSDRGQIEVEDISETHSDDLRKSSPSSLSEGAAIYDLSAYIAEIRKDKGRAHVVAHIKGKFLEFNRDIM